MKRLLLSLVVIFALYNLNSISAQNYIGVQFNAMQPLNDYGENIQVVPKGLSLNYMFKPKAFKHLYVGANLGVSMYATDNYNETVSHDQQNIEVEISEEDCFIAYGLTARYMFVEDNKLSPYLEARLGGLSFFSTKMTEESYDDYYENSTSFHGTAFQIGMGLGLSYHVIDNLWIDINGVYNKGSFADYRNIGSTDVELRTGNDFGKYTSYTDNLSFSFGVQFGF